MIVLHTSVLIKHLRGRAEAHTALRRAVEDDQLLAASVLTKVEVTPGCEAASAAPSRTLFSAMEWLPVTDEIAEDAGSLARQYRRSHQSIDVVDYVIAATARTLGADAWTLNVKHFPMVEGIRPPF